MTICKGCGALLQTSDPNAPGYTPKEGSAYCKRCFRLIHYDDLTVSMRTGIDPDDVLRRIAEIDGPVVWVVDLFDFESSMIPGLSRKLNNKEILLVCTKRDLLPETLSHEKLAKFIFGRLKEYGITVENLILTSSFEEEGMEDVREAVAEMSQGRPVVFMGRANSGKSTLLNHLMGENVLTSSRYPGTTVDFNTIELDGITYIDTPGVELSRSVLMCVDEKELKNIIPTRTLKPQIFQIHGEPSFSIGGLARIDLKVTGKATIVFYISDEMKLHRGQASKADELWSKHYGELLTPVALDPSFDDYTTRKEEEKLDVVIDGLGWACVSGEVSTIHVKAPKGVNVTFRKAMV